MCLRAGGRNVVVTMRALARITCIALATVLFACGNGSDSNGTDSEGTPASESAISGGDPVKTPPSQVDVTPEPEHTGVPTPEATPTPAETGIPTAIPTATPTVTEDPEKQPTP